MKNKVACRMVAGVKEGTSLNVGSRNELNVREHQKEQWK